MIIGLHLAAHRERRREEGLVQDRLRGPDEGARRRDDGQLREAARPAGDHGARIKT